MIDVTPFEVVPVRAGTAVSEDSTLAITVLEDAEVVLADLP